MKFSIRDLLVGVLLIAVAISLVTLFTRWRRGYVEQEYRVYQTLENLRSLSKGDSVDDVRLLFSSLILVDRDLAKVILSSPELSSADEVFAVAISDAEARFLHFRDGQLVDFTFTASDVQKSLKSLQAASPPWYILNGEWVIAVALLLVFGLVLGVLRLRRVYKPAARAREL